MALQAKKPSEDLFDLLGLVAPHLIQRLVKPGEELNPVISDPPGGPVARFMFLEAIGRRVCSLPDVEAKSGVTALRVRVGKFLFAEDLSLKTDDVHAAFCFFLTDARKARGKSAFDATRRSGGEVSRNAVTATGRL